MPISLELTGDLSIRGIDAAHAQLSDAFRQDGDVLVSVAADAIVDLTFVQMIEAGRKSAGAAGRDFRVATAASGALLETLGRGGFLESPGDRDFWLTKSGN